MNRFLSKLAEPEAMRSIDAAQETIDLIRGQIALAEASGVVTPHIINKDRTVLDLSGVPIAADEPNSPEYINEWERHRRAGFIGKLTLVRDTDTSRVKAIDVIAVLPAVFDAEPWVLNRADQWHTRWQFPRQESAMKQPRVVMDRWCLPLVKLSKAQKALRDNGRTTESKAAAAYEKFFDRVFVDTDAHGIAVGAVAITHTILGRPEPLGSGRRALLRQALSEIIQGTQQGIEHYTLVAASIQAEKAIKKAASAALMAAEGIY